MWSDDHLGEIMTLRHLISYPVIESVLFSDVISTFKIAIRFLVAVVYI